MTGLVCDYALRYLQSGYVPLPVEPGTKAARFPGWQTIMSTEENIARQFKRPSNLGIRTGDVRADGSCLLAIDIDLDDHSLMRVVEQAIGKEVPCKRGRKGATWFVRCDEPLRKQKLHWYRNGTKTPAGDVLCVGSQTVVPPSIHPDTHQPYHWVSSRPLDEVPYEDLPLFSRSLIDELHGFCKSADDPICALNDMQWRGVGGGGDTHDICVRAVASMVARGWPDEDIHARVERAKREACEAAGMPYDWPQSQKIIQEWINTGRAKFGAEGNRRKSVSHGALADAFLEQGADHIRFDRDAGCWYVFNGQVWCTRHDFRVLNLIENSLPVALRNSPVISGIEKSLRNRPELSIQQQDWDPDLSLLNTSAGVVDLKSGQVRPAFPRDLMTRITSVAPADSWMGSLWSQKLIEWFGDDEVEQAYIQTLAGYFLTGETRHACLPLWIGPGGDGKSVIANIFRYILGDYAKTSTDTAFVDTRHSQHSEELAWLNGARLVLVNEINGSLPWNDSRIKAVTGGEHIAASYKRGHVFEYRPSFKLLITGNEAPQLRSVGPEFRRRFHVYKFTRGVANPDAELLEKLKAEAGLILRWMIDGAIRYYREGLAPSPAVEFANAEYFEANDLIQQWIAECCEVGDGVRVVGGEAYVNYTAWCETQGIKWPLTRQRFTAKLAAKGFASGTGHISGRDNSARCYFGLRLRAIGGDY